MADNTDNGQKSFTGLNRRKQTPWTVRFGDKLASRTITVGGIGTIIAVMLVVVVLIATAAPLFFKPQIQDWVQFSLPDYEQFGCDENSQLLWGMLGNGSIEVRSTHDGSLLSTFDAPDSTAAITCTHLSIDRRLLTLGYADGTVRSTELNFLTELLASSALPSEVRISPENPMQTYEDSVYEYFDRFGVRRTTLTPPNWSTPRELGTQPVIACDYLPPGTTNRFATSSIAYLAAIVGDEIVLAEIESKRNLLTRKTTESLQVQRCPLLQRTIDQSPLLLMLWDGERQIVVAWKNGKLDRYAKLENELRFAESSDANLDGGSLTCAAPLLARQTLMCGDSLGNVTGWMIVQPSDPTTITTTDGMVMVPARELKTGDQAIQSISSSQQSHVALIGSQSGEFSLAYLTNQNRLQSFRSPLTSQTNAFLNPVDNSIFSIGYGSIAWCPVQLGYPAASLRGYFGKVWYEGHDRPKYIWQSSSGTETAEAKFSLVPLVFGTIKATLYAMLFSIPLAMCAAVYTSEFLSPKSRSRVKPIIEFMASLPSVVLGYIAALVLAPALQTNLMTVILSVYLIPLSFVTAGHAWNLVPQNVSARTMVLRLPLLLATLFVACLLAWLLSDPIEQAWFSGDIVQWLSGSGDQAAGGWILALLPLVSLLSVLALNGPLAIPIHRQAVHQTPKTFARYSLARLAVTVAVICGLSILFGHMVASWGWDLRDSFLTGYKDRNAMLVGFALGFCVIPLIYTISEDALQSVPRQLRSAALGCGATPWQTTTRVVIPSAMSGLFSAIMIGLGRAVGETMVVLMASGNTPLTEWNPFNGFQTLSATLATELPEAAKGSIHYRTLFLAALLLFMLTLIANTLAELVRIRFRKRASQL